eukprot:1159812-Prymnesium_polylepis.1
MVRPTRIVALAREPERLLAEPIRWTAWRTNNHQLLWQRSSSQAALHQSSPQVVRRQTAPRPRPL